MTTNESQVMTQNFMVNDTYNALNPHRLHEETQMQQDEQKSNLLRFLENQNAEALRAIQHENSYFIEQCGGLQERDTSYFSAELK